MQFFLFLVGVLNKFCAELLTGVALFLLGFLVPKRPKSRPLRPSAGDGPRWTLGCLLLVLAQNKKIKPESPEGRSTSHNPRQSPLSSNQYLTPKSSSNPPSTSTTLATACASATAPSLSGRQYRLHRKCRCRLLRDSSVDFNRTAATAVRQPHSSRLYLQGAAALATIQTPVHYGTTKLGKKFNISTNRYLYKIVIRMVTTDYEYATSRANHITWPVEHRLITWTRPCLAMKVMVMDSAQAGAN